MTWTKRILKDVAKGFRFHGLLIALALSSMPGYGLTSESLVAEVQRKKETLRDYQVQRRMVLSEIFSLEKSIKELVQKKTEITSRSQRMEIQVERVGQRIEQLSEEVNQLRVRVSGGMRALNRVSEGRFIRSVLSAVTPAELDRNIKLLRILVASEFKTLDEFRAAHQSLVAEKEHLEKSLELLSLEQIRIATMEADLKSENQKKMEMIGQFERRRQAEIEGLRKLRLRSLNILADQLSEDQEIEEYLRPSFMEYQGQLRSPVEGSVLVSFGLVRDEELQTELFHSGWFVRSNSSVSVVAPFDSLVALRSEDSKLGQVVILDHGHDFYTVYSGLSTAYVRPGERISEGDILGLTGYSSRWGDYGVSFEIRHFSEPQDPKRWIKRQEDLFPAKQANL